MTIAVLAVAAAVAASTCGGSPASPTPPQTPPTTPPVTPPAPARVAVSGVVTGTVTGRILPGLSIEVGGQPATTDESGRFKVEWDYSASRSFPITTISGPHILTRTVWLSAPSSRDVSLDVIELNAQFDPDFFRQFARDGLTTPEFPRAIRRWTRSPRIYMRTVDEAGLAVDPETLNTAEAALLDDPGAFTGGQFGIAEIVRGTETRQGVAGWITVKWPNPSDPGVCGRAQIALEGGWIELHHLTRNCECGRSRVGAGLVRHELGHAMGFYHTDRAGDLMGPSSARADWCTTRPSARERLHAAYAYSRPNGNIEPDNDPSSVLHRHPGPPIVVVD